MSKIDFINNLRGIEQGEDIPRDYLSGIYDSIENSPIVMSDDEFSRSTISAEDQHKNLQDMLNNTRSAESLLRGLAVHDFRFATIEDLAENLKLTPREALAKLTRSLVSETWHQWHSVISTCLETAHLDLQGMEPCVDILLYALSITVCLDMPTERTAFLGQLGRLKSFEELRQGRWVHAPDYESFRGEAWYLELEEACCGTDDRKIWALRNIREWMESVQEALLDDVRNKAELTKACAQLDDGDTLLQDPARSFVRAGKLTKKSGRTGRNTEYHFVLFSDLLLYSKLSSTGGKYKIHEELPLHLTKVVDWFPSSQKNKQHQNVFEIHHPRKSFQVVCRDAEERKSWVKDIREAILMEVERKMMLEAARLAVHISKA
jgi:PH domain/Sec7 domain